MTKTEICSQSLALVGGKVLTDFATDVTVAGQLCRLLFDPTTNELLERYPWTFSLRRADLGAELQDVPAHGYDHAYQLPPNVLKVWETNLGDQPWAIEDDHLLTNGSEVSITYAIEVTDTASFSPGFSQALTYLLAAKLAVPVARSLEMATLYHSKTDQMIAVGQGANASTSNEVYEPNSLIDVRY